MFSTQNLTARSSWWHLFLLTFLAICAYVFMEWLFLVTMPSFMSALGWLQKLEILTFSILLLYGLAALVLIPLTLVGALPTIRARLVATTALIAIGAILPALILGALTMLLVDNFTYTLFSFGVVTSQGLRRGLYAALFLLAVGLWWRYLLKKIGTQHWPTQSSLLQKVVYPGLMVAALIPLPFIGFQIADRRQQSDLSFVTSSNRPNILMITSDGVNATSLSLYGYERDTTPYLRELAPSALLAENAFTNAGSTTGTIVSIYTGKSPMRTRVLYPPDILRGADAYQHLPAILKSLGYYNIQVTMPHYADALTQNILEGFDRVNGRDVGRVGSLAMLNRFLPIDEANFSSELVQRLAERLGHIFYLSDMQNPYAQVTEPAKNMNLDEKRKLRSSLKLLEASEQPVFIHIHLFGTHGPRYYPLKQIFSAGQDENQQERWNVDFYDDSIHEFDQMVGMVIKELTQKGLLDNTILIIGSDHGKRWDSLQRIPLLIRFPHEAHAGVIQVNAQTLDLSPTILDYLGIDKPDWMEGESLLTIGSTQRPIIAVTNIGAQKVNQKGFTETDQEKASPPFYQFGTISVIYCQKWNRLWLNNRTLNIGEIAGHTAPCSQDELLTTQQAFDYMVDVLKANDFDVSSLKDFKTVSAQP